MEATNISLQAAALEQRMQQVDTDWEALTRSIQADKQRLIHLQERLDNLRLLLSLPLDEPPDETPAMLAQLAYLEQQCALLQQRITTQDVQRNAVAQQFDQAHVAWVALRHMSPERSFGRKRAYKRIAFWLRRALSVFRVLLERPANSGGIIRDDLSLRRHASTGDQ